METKKETRKEKNETKERNNKKKRKKNGIQERKNKNAWLRGSHASSQRLPPKQLCPGWSLRRLSRVTATPATTSMSCAVAMPVSFSVVSVRCSGGFDKPDHAFHNESIPR